MELERSELRVKFPFPIRFVPDSGREAPAGLGMASPDCRSKAGKPETLRCLSNLDGAAGRLARLKTALNPSSRVYEDEWNQGYLEGFGCDRGY